MKFLEKMIIPEREIHHKNLVLKKGENSSNIQFLNTQTSRQRLLPVNLYFSSLRLAR